MKIGLLPVCGYIHSWNVCAFIPLINQCSMTKPPYNHSANKGMRFPKNLNAPMNLYSLPEHIYHHFQNPHTFIAGIMVLLIYQ